MEQLFLAELKQFKAEIDRIIAGDSFESTMCPSGAVACIGDYMKAFQQFSTGGKRIRAYLVSLGYQMAAVKYDPAIILPALSYEVFQSGILIHDDIIDESDTRRGMPTMHITLGGDQNGISKAICLGDIGLFAAVDLVARADFDSDLVRKAIMHQIKVFELTGAGEIKDIELAVADSANEERIVKMYRLKTSWYTMIGPMQLGAILGCADDTLMQQIEKIGMAMGIAFQIVDDIIGIYGKSDKIGKSNLSDMQEGKKTVLSAHFFAHAAKKQADALRAIYGNRESGAEELQTVRALFRETGSYDYANALCKRYADEASAVIDTMQVDEKYRDILRSFLDYLCGRDV